MFSGYNVGSGLGTAFMAELESFTFFNNLIKGEWMGFFA